MAPRPPKVSPLIKCGNPACGRPLDAVGYDTSVPADTPPERIHVVDRPNEPRRTVGCFTCGHYTVNKPWREGEK